MGTAARRAVIVAVLRLAAPLSPVEAETAAATTPTINHQCLSVGRDAATYGKPVVQLTNKCDFDIIVYYGEGNHDYFVIDRDFTLRAHAVGYPANANPAASLAYFACPAGDTLTYVGPRQGTAATSYTAGRDQVACLQ